VYESFFKLIIKPFDLLPNPYFLYMSKSHKKALTYLEYALQERAGFIILTGEIGSGKTTLIRSLINKHYKSFVLSRICNTKVSSEQLLTLINDDFGIPVRSREKTDLLRDLNDFLVSQYAIGNRPVLIIDEAQNLTPEILEDVRMLSNLETDNAKLLQIILVGQPELKRTLALPELVQLRQRISFYCHIRPLTREELENYILHRMEIAGNREAVVFKPEALDLIWKYSRGIPRLINIICDFLLLSAFADELKEISTNLTKEVIGDLDFEKQFWGKCEVTSGEEEKTHNDRSASVQEGVHLENETHRLLSEILQRLDALEKREVSPGEPTIEDMGQRLKRSEHDLQEYIRTTTLKIDELRRDLNTDKNSDAISASSCEGEGERKKGFLGKLFRAV